MVDSETAFLEAPARMKSTLARLGIRNFKADLRKASECLAGVRTPEGAPLPPNTMTELRRDIARLQLVKEQISQIGQTRLEWLRQPPADVPHAMLAPLACVYGIGIETPDMLGTGCWCAICARPTGGGAVRRDHRGARRKQRWASRAGPRPRRQCPVPHGTRPWTKGRSQD